MSRLLTIAYLLVLISFGDILNGEQIEINHTDRQPPIVFYELSGDVTIPNSIGNAMPDRNENRHINSAFASFQAIAFDVDIGVRGTAESGWSIEILSKTESYKNHSFLSYVNTMRLNFNKQTLDALKNHGDLITTLDLSTSDATSEQINILLGNFKKLKILILPFSASYDITKLIFHSSIEKLVIYNQIVNSKFISDLGSRESLKEIVFWGCLSEISRDIFDVESSTNRKNMEYFSYLKNIKCINCNVNLYELLFSFNMPNIELVTTDNWNTFKTIISNEKLSRIELYSTKFNRTTGTAKNKKTYNHEIIKRVTDRHRKVKTSKLIIDVYY